MPYGIISTGNGVKIVKNHSTKQMTPLDLYRLMCSFYQSAFGTNTQQFLEYSLRLSIDQLEMLSDKNYPKAIVVVTNSLHMLNDLILREIEHSCNLKGIQLNFVTFSQYSSCKLEKAYILTSHMQVEALFKRIYSETEE
jgi:formyltetrahydrofolate hydrolase